MTEQPSTIVVACNDDRVLHQNLLRSPSVRDGRYQLILKRGYASAALAYNSALDDARDDLVIFVHQDIYLPVRWFSDLQRAIDHLKRQQLPWGVLGCFGSRAGAAGGLGRVYTRGMGQHGRRLDGPTPVETLDEIVLVIRRSSGLRFDEQLPHYHLYGPDLCLAARERGLPSYAFQGYCIHNTQQLLALPPQYYDCYWYVRRKWAHRLPIYTSCMTISALNVELYRKRFDEARQRWFPSPLLPARRVDDPTVFAMECVPPALPGDR